MDCNNKAKKRLKENTRTVRLPDVFDLGFPEPTTQRNSKNIISRKKRKRKVSTDHGYLALTAAAVFLLLAVVVMATCVQGSMQETGEPLPESQTYTFQQATEKPVEKTKEKPTETEEPEISTVYFIADGDDGEPLYIDMEAVTNSWAAEAGLMKRYNLTDKQRYKIASVVTAEAEGECFAGKMAIAQCILQAAEDDEISPVKVLKSYSYTSRRPKPSDESFLAVSAVFDFGWVVTSEPIKYFYNPDLVESSFHESQSFVVTIGSHRFFKKKGGGSRDIHIQQEYSPKKRKK